MAKLGVLNRPGGPAPGGRPPEGPPPGGSTLFLRLMPYLFIIAVVIADVLTSRDITFTPMLPVAPAIAALGRGGVRGVLLAATAALGVLVPLYLYDSDVATDVLAATAAAVLAVTAVSCISIRILSQQSRVLADVRSVAEAAQHVVLRDIPADLGQVRTAHAYEAAAAEARIGGDLYAGLHTPHGDRFIVGDVRGKGLPAVEAAADVLGVFREAAHTEPALTTVAQRIHDVLARRPSRDEDFVTAVLLSVHPHSPTVEIVDCGHPPPLLLHAGRVDALTPQEPGPPLGLFDLTATPCRPYTAPFAPGDTLLLYTDGTTEARDAAGRFFPLPEYLSGAAFRRPEDLLALVRAGLRDHAGARLDDDVALVAVQRKAVDGGGEAVRR